MTKFVFADDDCQISAEITVEAETEREARRLSWAQLSDEEKDACGCWTCVDVIGGAA